MSDEVPVKRRDLLALAALSVGGGVLIASVTITPEISPQFFNAIGVGAVLLAFFLFVPVLGLRLFLEERNDGESSP